ncbi:MAG: hypothetical protein RL033_3104 [Pseudomonadota bacterium]|jgi:hypothetical protein
MSTIGYTESVKTLRSGAAPRTRSLARGCATALLWLAAPLSSGCGGSEALGVSALSVVSAGVVNDPANKSLRFDLLKFGLERFCVEMQRRGAPLKLSDTEPVLGRFFADSCQARVIDEDQRQSVVVSYSGSGYGWTNLTGRLGFSSSGSVEYAADFQQREDAMYIYFRPRSVAGIAFRTLMIESALAQIGIGVAGVDANAIGQDIVRRQIERGFTVIRHSARGDAEFSTGLVPMGARPFRPFQVQSSDKQTLDNDRTEVHTGQQDLIGGLYVPDSGRKLSLHLSLDGVAAVDVLLLPEAQALALLRGYVNQAGPARLTAAPVVDAELHAGQPLQLEFKVQPGNYYLLLDHSALVGRSTPPAGDQAAKIDYLVQLGE